MLYVDFDENWIKYTRMFDAHIDAYLYLYFGDDDDASNIIHIEHDQSSCNVNMFHHKQNW